MYVPSSVVSGVSLIKSLSEVLSICNVRYNLEIECLAVLLGTKQGQVRTK